jgi:NOL1/NOP2/fmu family ribosome biogenesis protein
MENTAEKIEQEIEMESQDLEIEVVDDTPEEDRGKPKRAENIPPQIPDDDEVSKYSGDVQKRIKQLKYEYHEERRQKEEAKRLSDEAITATQKLMEENRKLKKTLDDGEGVLVEQAKGRVQAQLEKAKQEYKEAYEAGDSDKLIEAQEKLSTIQNEKYRVDNYKPPVRAVEPEVSPPQQAPAQPKVQEPTGKDKEWLEANSDWFQKEDHEDMTGYAMGVHQKLVKAGLNPKLDTEEYYRRIDEAMGKAFPEHFNSNKQSVETEEVEAPQRSAGNVVAPVNRSAKKPRKVQLTSTQIGLAKRLGVTPEQYAAQLLKESI